MGWGPAVLNNQAELDFIRQAQRWLSDDRSYWIGGSTNINAWNTFQYNNYMTEDSGNMTNIMKL